MTTVEESKAIAERGRKLWRSTLNGDAPPLAGELRQRMRSPKPGDLVIEISGFGGFDPDGVGRLVSVEGEPPDYERFVVAPLHKPDVEQGWQNSTFIALPTPDDDEWKTYGF